MPTYPLPYRIKDFLRRQIAWSHTVLEELEHFCAAPRDADFELILDAQRRREQESSSMVNEYQGLADEWANATDIAPEDEVEIKGLSKEAESLVEKLRSAYQAADAEAAKYREEQQNAMNDLRRSRRSVNIYRPGVLVDPGFIDRKA